MTIFSKNLGGHGPFAPPACAYEWMKGLQKAKSDEMVPGCRQQLGSHGNLIITFSTIYNIL